MNQRSINSKTISTFWLLAILIFQPAGIYVGIASGMPKLDEMAGEWLPMQNVANPPDVNNFHDMLLINRDLTSFFCYPDDWLWSGQPRFGYAPVILTVDGKEYPAKDCRWYPYRALRRNLNCAGLAIETDTRMINEQRAVLLRVRITIPARQIKHRSYFPFQAGCRRMAFLSSTPTSGQDLSRFSARHRSLTL